MNPPGRGPAIYGFAPRPRFRWTFGALAAALGIMSSVAVPAAGDVPPFRTGILPLLTKAGCNAGACHGAATGQGGFKLSLLGYDAEADHLRITRELAGRRIDLTVPTESLILRKPSRQLDHEGGRRLPRNSSAYAAIAQWIAAGAPYGPRDLRVESIQVSPEESLLDGPGHTLPLRVTATWSDGSSHDVTELSLFTSNDDAIAEVGPAGMVKVSGSGQTSIMIRHGGQVAAARIAVPYNATATAILPFPANNFVDEHVGAALRRLRLPASPLSDAGEFLRRVHLDLIGRLPTLDEQRAFEAAAGQPDARDQVIDRLLARKEFVDLWTLQLADLLLVGGRRADDAAARAYHEWLRGEIARNAPFDGIVRSLLTASGGLTAEPAANFFTVASDPRDLAEHASRMFLGTRIACARCHAHPADRWTQEDYHRFAAYFARVVREGDRVRAGDRGEVDDPKTGRPLSPKPLGDAAPPTGSNADRRIELAQWMTSPDTRRFAQTIANRTWKVLLGRGLVEPVDDLRPTNPPSHPALLDALAADFVSHGHDLRHLIRTIARSRTYQLTSRTLADNRADDRCFSHAALKQLPAQVFLDAVSQVTGVPEPFEGYPEGTRAVELVGVKTPSPALDLLGRCLRESACDSGGGNGGGLAQALHLINGPTIGAKLPEAAAQLLASHTTHRDIVEELYRRALARPPRAEELAAWEKELAQSAARAEAVEDLLWTLLNSREFAFNH